MSRFNKFSMYGRVSQLTKLPLRKISGDRTLGQGPHRPLTINALHVSDLVKRDRINTYLANLMVTKITSSPYRVETSSDPHVKIINFQCPNSKSPSHISAENRKNMLNLILSVIASPQEMCWYVTGPRHEFFLFSKIPQKFLAQKPNLYKIRDKYLEKLHPQPPMGSDVELTAHLLVRKTHHRLLNAEEDQLTDHIYDE